MKRRWRKGHQWVGLARPHAALVASTGWYEALEAAHAASAVAAEFRREFARQHRGADADSIHHCFADEHLVATVLANEGVEAELVAASPTLIRFGAFGGRRRLLALDINGRMKRDWRATSYDPAHITPAFLADARAYCDYGPEAAPLAAKPLLLGGQRSHLVRMLELCSSSPCCLRHAPPSALPRSPHAAPSAPVSRQH